MISRYHVASLAAALITAAPAAAPAQTIEPSRLHLVDALKIANEAVKIAADGQPVAVVIVNAEGNVIASMRMDGASFINVGAAEQKARTAIALASPTKQAEQALVHGDLSLLAINGMLPMAGGVPIVLDDRVIGGIGVSGREPAADDRLAISAGRVFGTGAESGR